MARPRKITHAFRKARAQDRRLGTFLRRHYRDIACEFADGIDWSIAMTVFRQHDLRDEHGQPVSLATASRTWRRIRREMEAKEAARAVASPPALRSGEVAPGVRPVTQIPNRPGPAAPVPAPASVPEARATPGPVPATASGTPAAQAADGATELILDVLARMGARRVPLPRRG